MRNGFGYVDPFAATEAQDLGAVDPFMLAALGPAAAAAYIQQMSPAQAAQLIRDIDRNGLGEYDEELAGIFDVFKKIAGTVVSGVQKVASIAAPVASIAAGFIPGLSPLSTVLNVASGAQQAAGAGQVVVSAADLARLQAAAAAANAPQIQAWRASGAEQPAWLIPALVVGAALLLSRR